MRPIAGSSTRGPTPIQHRPFQERGMHHALVHEGLQPMQQGLTGGAVARHRLLLEQGVEIRRAAIREACPEHIVRSGSPRCQAWGSRRGRAP